MLIPHMALIPPKNTNINLNSEIKNMLITEKV